MKKIFAILLVTFVCCQSQAQYYTQGADGKGSIPLPLKGTALSVDIGKTNITLGANNYARALQASDDSLKHILFYGVNLSGKSADGLANIFSKGDIVPEGNFLGFAGLTFSNNANLLDDYKKGKQEALRLLRIAQEDQLLATYKSSIITVLKGQANLINDADLRRTAIREMSNNVTAAGTADDVNQVITDYRKNDANLDDFRKAANAQKGSFFQDFIDGFNALQKRQITPNDQYFKEWMQKARPFRFSAFLQGGILARSFTRYISLDSSNYPNSFQDTLFRGGSFGLGVNFQYCNYWFGATYTYQAGDNFADLTSKDYTLRTTNTSSSQALVSEKKISAYTGKYGHLETNQLNLDVIGEFNLGDTSHLLVNPYLRSSLFSRDTSLQTNYTNIGLGFYFLGKNSKFLGGLYVELPDINNNAEKAKPLSEMNVRPPFKKLTFGIVTKISLSSIFNFSNVKAPTD